MSKFGYSAEQWARLKILAEFQFDTEVDCVAILDEENGQYVHCPWVDTSSRFHLSDEEAIKERGEVFLKRWCKVAETFLREHCINGEKYWDTL